MSCDKIPFCSFQSINYSKELNRMADSRNGAYNNGRESVYNPDIAHTESTQAPNYGTHIES